MMKRTTLLAFFTALLFSASGQSQQPTRSLSSLVKIDGGLQGLGLSLEPGLSNKITADLAAGAGGGYDIAESSLSYNLSLNHPAFYFSLTPKYYYNLEKRIRKGKTTLLNSGNYIGIRLKYVTPNNGQTDDDTRNSILVNIHWGMQRALGSHWLFNAHAGAGYAQDIDYNFGTIYPALDFKFAYVLSGH
ncbi:MAG: hypothetical protein INR73_01955 [Williamsia sp.]|nr:hypothetical protein [Williamsia sp.]